MFNESGHFFKTESPSPFNASKKFISLSASANYKQLIMLYIHEQLIKYERQNMYIFVQIHIHQIIILKNFHHN